MVPAAAGGPAAPADGRSPYRTTCPYLRQEGPDGGLLAPVEQPDGANRCTAIGWPVEPSRRQQATACLSSEHTACPRFIHAEAAPAEAAPVLAVVPVAAQRPQARSRATRPAGIASRPSSPATLAALLALLASASLSFAFVLVRGGLALPPPSAPAANEVAGSTGTPAPTMVAAVLTPAPATPTPAPTPTPTAPPTPAPTPTPTAAPTPAPTATPRATSQRYAYLKPCPTRPNCWIYTIRSGDALSALANYFGHSLETVYRLNPWTKTRGIHPGDQLILPPPTR
jgi:hypothetical protein